MRIALAIGLAVAAGALAPGASAEQTSSACGSITAGEVRYTVRIERGHLACTTARAVLRTFIVTGKPPPGLRTPPRGWACFRGHSNNAWAAACAGGRNAIIRAYTRS